MNQAVLQPLTDTAARGRAAQRDGLRAEQAACAALERDGWTVLARRLRTPAGEIDIAAERDGLLAFVEVKSRATLATAAAAISERQRARLLQAAAIVLGDHPDWGRNGVRFDAMLVGANGQVRRVRDAFRAE